MGVILSGSEGSPATGRCFAPLSMTMPVTFTVAVY